MKPLDIYKVLKKVDFPENVELNAFKLTDILELKFSLKEENVLKEDFFVIRVEIFKHVAFERYCACIAPYSDDIFFKITSGNLLREISGKHFIVYAPSPSEALLKLLVELKEALIELKLL
ncbi:hypothetical protein [Persephonella sp.]